MKALYFYIALLAVTVSFASCAKTGVECAGKGKPYKVKKYRVKKPKGGKRVYASGGGSGSSSSSSKPTASSQSSQPSTQPAQAPEQNTEQTAQNKPVAEENTRQSIPDLKTGAPPKEGEKVEFRGETITVTEESGFTFEEAIVFIDQSDLFDDINGANQQITDLANLLKSNKNIKTTVVGNAATDAPMAGILYGDDNKVLMQKTVFHADTVQIKDVMNFRAKRVYDLLIKKGVPKDQLDYTTGSYRKYASQRVVSFIVRRKEQ